MRGLSPCALFLWVLLPKMEHARITRGDRPRFPSMQHAWGQAPLRGYSTERTWTTDEESMRNLTSRETKVIP